MCYYIYIIYIYIYDIQSHNSNGLQHTSACWVVTSVNRRLRNVYFRLQWHMCMLMNRRSSVTVSTIYKESRATQYLSYIVRLHTVDRIALNEYM